MKCFYCGAEKCKPKYKKQCHKVDPTFGPFDLYACDSCGSLSTDPLPTAERLSEFYINYEKFRPDWYNAASGAGALAAQYRFYASRAARPVRSGQTWLDVGAGHGEVSNLLSDLRPGSSGNAIDIGERPVALSDSVTYQSIDLNKDNWLGMIGRQFDHVFSVAVWEHVRTPQQFARESLSLVSSGGTLTMICPDYGSLASQVLGRSWPYFEPGEHISIPTRKGARICLEKAVGNLGVGQFDIKVSRLNVGYSIRYLFDVLRLKSLAAITPSNLSLPLPTGILIAEATRRR